MEGVDVLINEDDQLNGNVGGIPVPASDVEEVVVELDVIGQRLEDPIEGEGNVSGLPINIINEETVKSRTRGAISKDQDLGEIVRDLDVGRGSEIRTSIVDNRVESPWSSAVIDSIGKELSHRGISTSDEHTVAQPVDIIVGQQRIGTMVVHKRRGKSGRIHHPYLITIQNGRVHVLVPSRKRNRFGRHGHKAISVGVHHEHPGRHRQSLAVGGDEPPGRGVNRGPREKSGQRDGSDPQAGVGSTDWLPQNHPVLRRSGLLLNVAAFVSSTINHRP